jgi:gluconolactonase
VRAEAEVSRVATGFVFTEGPVWHPTESHLIFSDIIGNRMLRWSELEGLAVYREPSNMANGNAYDGSGRLVTCEHATSRLVRTGEDGAVTVLASHFEDRELNSPNDVVVRSDGSIYFTDPDSGRKEPWGIPRQRDLSYCGVYRLVPGGELTLLVADFEVPNGLCFSPDETRLFINDTRRRHIRIFDLKPDGTISGGEIWADIEGKGADRPPDGMKIDQAGNLYCTGPGGIHVFDPGANRLGVILVPEDVGNFTWGGSRLLSLFITASTSLYRVEVMIPGRPAF